MLDALTPLEPMELITLSNSAVYASIDAQDLEIVSQYSWCVTPNGYVKALRSLSLHRLIGDRMGIPKDSHIDHKNGNKLDCRRDNLRAATRQENNRNKNKHWGGVKFKGVSKSRSKKNPYRANITINRRTIALGMFPTAEQAAIAYDTAAIENFGEFAKTNKMLGLINY
jgi:hypothetical protein